MDNSQYSINRFQFWILVAILFFSMFIVALPMMGAFYIVGDLGASTDMASWSVTFFLVGAITTKPAGRVLSNHFGFFNVIKVSLGLTILVFIPILFVNNFNAFLAFRYLGGMASGPIFSAVTYICKNQRPPEETNFFLVLVLTILLVAPILGTVFGAVIAYADYWRLSFGAVYAMGFILYLLLFIFFRKSKTPLEQVPIDFVGIITFWISFTGLGFCLITGQIIDGFRSFAFNLILIVSSCIMLFFLIWNAMHPYRIIVWHHFKKPKVALAIIQLTFIIGFFSAINMLLSYWLTLYANYTVKWVGYTLSLTIIAPIGLLIVHHFRKSKGSIWVYCISLLILFGIAFGGSHLNVEVDLFRIGVIKLINGLSYAIALPIIVHNIEEALPGKEFLEGWILFVVFKLFGYLVAIATFAILWERRAAFYHWRLGGELTAISDPLQNTFRWLSFFNFTPLMKEEGLNVALNRQSRALALDDCFYLIAWISLSLLIITSLYATYEYLKSKKPKEAYL